jgi:hypothetical protein
MRIRQLAETLSPLRRRIGSASALNFKLILYDVSFEDWFFFLRFRKYSNTSLVDIPSVSDAILSRSLRTDFTQSNFFLVIVLIIKGFSGVSYF